MTKMRAEERFPVVLRYAAPAKYAKGGLVDAALAVKKAGRYGDTEIIHVNKIELEELKQMWGEPTTNPKTGQPEFFLGFLKKLLPIAAMFIPGIGPAIGGALGVGATAGNALLGAGLGALNGGASGALTGGVLGALSPKFKLGSKAPAVSAAGVSPTADAATQAAQTATAANAATGAAPGVLVADQTKPNFWNRGFLGTGIKNKYAIPALGIAGAALLGNKGSNQTDGPPDQAAQDKFLNPVYKSEGRSPQAGFQNLGRRNSVVDDRVFQAYNAGFLPERANFNYVEGGYAKGGTVEPGGGSPFAVKGSGGGREDKIPAALSDGEYVMDAETVAMLGDGSTKAGAQKLDALRVNLRKHKGKNLAKGKISLAAKRPEAYMSGGRV